MTLAARTIAYSLLCILTLPTPAMPFGFPGVDGTIRDGIRRERPNPSLAVGPGTGAAGRVVLVTSAGIQLWDETGASLGGPTPVDVFLGTAPGAVLAAQTLYDQHAGRFVVVALEGDTPDPGGTSILHVAVSTSATPDDLAADWVRLAGSGLTTVGGHETYLDGDDAGLGVGADANGLYVTANLVDGSGIFRGAKIRVFDTSPASGLLAGLYAFADLDLDRAVTPSPFYLRPAHVHGATDSGSFYVVNRANPAIGAELSFYRVLEIAGAPAAPVIVGDSLRGWYTGVQDLNGVAQAGTSVRLDPVETRILDADYRDGHVWAVLTAAWDGQSASEVVWAKLATNGGAPALPSIADLGVLRGSDGVEWVFNPAIAAGADGGATICFTQSYFDQFPEMRCAARAAGDPLATFWPSVSVATSASFYDGTSFPGADFELWGAHAAAVVDPDDDVTVWAANETVVSGAVDASRWGTFVARRDPPLPAPAPAGVEAAGLVLDAVLARRVAGGGAPGLEVPRALAMGPDGRSLHVGGPQGILTFERNPDTGRLHPADRLDDGAGLGSTQLELEPSPDGRHLYAVARGEGIGTFTRDTSTGTLAFASLVAADPFGGPLDEAEDVTLSPDGAHLYVANTGEDSLVVFARDAVTGALTFVQRLRNRRQGEGDVVGLRRPAGIVVSPEGAHVYSVHAGSLANGGQTLVAFTRDAVSGVLTHIETLTEGTGGIVGLEEPEAVVMSGDGAHVYVASSEDDSVTAWRRDAGTGRLTLLQRVGKATGVKSLESARALALAPDGTRLWVLASEADALVVFARDPDGGRLRYVGEHGEATGTVPLFAAGLAVVPSPDGRFLYTLSAGAPPGQDLFQGVGVGRGALVTWTHDACGSGRRTGLEHCDDGNVAGGDGCSETCRLELCPPTPRLDCREPLVAGAATLQMKNLAADKSDQLVWKWRRGLATPASDFGDPLADTDHVLCVYRDAGLVAGFAALAGGTCGTKPCWRALGGGKGFVLKDRDGAPDGIVTLSLKEGLADGQPKLDVKGKGLRLPLPGLPLDLPLTVQLANDASGVCWGARFSTAQRNDAQQLKARSE